MTDKKDEINLPKWPYKYPAKSKNIIDSSGIGFYDIQKIRNKSMSLFNKFKGECLNSIIDIENSMDIIILELLTSDINLRKDLYYLFFQKGAGAKLGFKEQTFSYLVRTKFYIYPDIKDTLNKIHVLIANMIAYRNVLAHSYLTEEIVKENGKIKHLIIPYRYKNNTEFMYSSKIKGQVLKQIKLIQIYFDFIYQALIEPKKIDVRFFYHIGYNYEKYKDSQYEMTFKRNSLPPIEEFHQNKKKLDKMFEPNYGVNPPSPDKKKKDV
jgi:hypothetical protein